VQDGSIEQIFAEITRQLEAKGLMLKRNTLIDASLVAARANPPRRFPRRLGYRHRTGRA